MALIDRIGVDVGRKLKLEDAIEWAARNQVRHIDIQLDTGENKVTMFDDARCRAIVASARANGVTIALHTLSAVNVAEYSPFLAEAVDASKPTTSHIVFLERVGMLFGLHRPSALLENLRHKVSHPVVLFYPGQRDGPAGLRFMDEAEADHNYRPKLFA